MPFTPAYATTDLPDGARIFAFVGAQALIRPDGSLPDGAALASLGPAQERILVGHLDGEACVLWLWPEGAVPEGLEVANLRKLWAQWPEGLALALGRALQLATWLMDHRYCGRCGHGLETAAHEPARHCPACRHRAYPRISPVCIGLVLRGSELLLGRSPHFAPGMYSALAGFLEAGENAEECLRREIREEAGVEICNIRWFGSQSWPFPHSLMLGFIADYAGGELCPQPGEIEDLQWFAPDALPLLPHPRSLAHRMIQAVLDGAKGQG